MKYPTQRRRTRRGRGVLPIARLAVLLAVALAGIGARPAARAADAAAPQWAAQAAQAFELLRAGDTAAFHARLSAALAKDRPAADVKEVWERFMSLAGEDIRLDKVVAPPAGTGAPAGTVEVYGTCTWSTVKVTLRFDADGRIGDFSFDPVPRLAVPPGDPAAAAAEAFVRDVVAGNRAAVDARLDKPKDAPAPIDAKLLVEQWAARTKDLGAARAVTAYTREQVGTWAVTRVRCEFADDALFVKVMMNAQGRVTSFIILNGG